ncbi:hypothetical protein N665_1182s0004 [Sinapis alba]|nr:hypothetical protein N665_1182s0004 [Sinapis alba]
MARFQGGLNRDVQDKLEMQKFNFIEEILHKVVLIEQHNKNQYGASSKSSYNKEERVFNKPKKEVKSSGNGRDNKEKAPATRSIDVKCFKCHEIGHYANECSNKKLMILLENGEYESEEEQPLIDTDEENMNYSVKRELLVTIRALSMKQKEEEQNYYKVCNLIIDGGSCTNVASSSLVEKLNLKWLSEYGDLKVQKQVKVPITIGIYTNEILCDVLPMEDGHILLERP